MKAAYRTISSVGMTPLPKDVARVFGPEPELAWLPVAELVIDTSYQRDINRQGVTNIRRIAENFNWAKFGAVICAPAEGGLYAVIDGQHRVTACALLGIRRAPCQIVAIDRAAQAAAFNAINSVVTRVHTLHAFAAAVTAGDPQAIEVAAVAARAGVEICRYPKERMRLNPGQTVAVAALGKALKRYGADVLTLALQCLRLPQHDRIGNINAVSIPLMTRAIGSDPRLAEKPTRTLAAMAKYDAREFADLVDSCTCAADVAACVREVADALLVILDGGRVRR